MLSEEKHFSYASENEISLLLARGGTTCDGFFFSMKHLLLAFEDYYKAFA